METAEALTGETSSASSTTSTTTTAAVITTSAAESTPATTTTNSSGEPVVVQNTSVRVTESVKSRIETNKTIIQRTTNTNAVQVNRYDAQGNLKSSDIDTSSWEDRNTQSYTWSKREEPPPEALAPPPTDPRFEQFFASADQPHQQPRTTDGSQSSSALVLTTAERRDVPAVSWSGTTASHQVDDLEGSEQHMTTKMDGSQWSRSGESVWISSGPVSPSSSSPSKTRPAIDGQPSPAGETNTATGAAGGDTPVSAGELSVEERRRRRAQQNRTRKAATAVAAVNSTAPSSQRTRPSPTKP